MINSKQMSELAYDIQSGLGRMDVPDFDSMRQMGMAASLCIHLRGLPEIEYDVLRKVSEHFFNIPSYALQTIINILADVEYIKIVKAPTGRAKSIIPTVPRFDDVYQGVGDYFSFSELNEHEQGTLLILSKLQNKADNKDRLLNEIGAEKDLWNRCLSIGEDGHYLKSYRARGKDILASPFYFADNLDSLIDITAKVGSKDIEVVLDLIKKNQGWPLSLIIKSTEVAGHSLTEAQKNLLIALCEEGVLKPPSIQFNSTSENFVFTPAPGASRLNPANREIYERAMALVSSVRKGQLLSDKYRIKMPIALLRALRNKGYVGSNSEAIIQYRNLVFLKIGKLKQCSGNKWEFHLNKIDENIKALDLAINLLETGELNNAEINNEARIALSKDEKYIQSIISSAELKHRKTSRLDEQSSEVFEQLLLEM